MGFITAFLLLALFWLIINLHHRQVSARTTVLPTATSSREISSPKLSKLGSHTSISLTSPVSLRAETTVFGNAHARLISVLSERGSWGYVIRVYYDAGALVAVIGQLFGLCALLWAVLHLGVRLLPSQKVLLRRSMGLSSQSNYVLKPLIPGLTLPFSHLLYIFASLVFCTAVHELGHALSAAAEAVPLISCGYSVLVMVPIAFVELSATLPVLPTRNRLRIAAAGAYHNLITLLLLMLLSTIPGSVWPWLGYHNVSTGVVVVHVQEDSPLHSYLLSGSIVTRVDDIFLAGGSAPELWKDLLLGEQVEEEQGWCVDANWFNGQTQACCAPSSLPHSDSCFIQHPTTMGTAGAGHCINPVPLFENQTLERCAYPTVCGVGNTCIAPHKAVSLLRLFVERSDKTESVIVWQGPRNEVWEQVTVGRYASDARSFMPISLPHIVHLLLEYTRTVSLSLFFFNILPVRMLDGGQIFSAVMETLVGMVMQRQRAADLETGQGRRGIQASPWTRRIARIQRVVEISTVTSVCILCVVGILS